MSIVEERYSKWLNHENLAPQYKPVLEAMNAEEKNDAFYTTIEFGTAGMRGLLGPGTNRINIHTIRKATQGYANYINENNGGEAGIAIGYDNRHMSKEFAFDCADLLAKNNIKSYVFESLRPTPELSFAVRHLNCFGGIMITASHNPKEYNGYKLYDDKGCQLIPCLASQVIDKVNAIEDELAIDANCTEEQKKLITVIGKDVDEEYYKNVLSIQLNPEVKKDIKIVFSPEHGTANIPVQEVYKRAGYTCIPVVEQCSPDPDFSNTPTPNPEQAGAYELSLKYAKENQADLILVCDPDADRMGVGVLHNGEYVVLTGNQSGSVEIEYICSQLQKQGKMPENPVMFNTVVTSDLGEKVASDYGVTTEKTLTGFKFIGEKVAKYEKTHEKNYVFGYEESYGSLIKPFVRDKDAVSACCLISEIAAWAKDNGKTLYQLLLDIYVEYGFSKEKGISVVKPGKSGAEEIKQMMVDFRNNPPRELAGSKVILWKDFQTLKQIDEDGRVTKIDMPDKSNVLQYFTQDGGKVSIRPSGTEPKIKFYCEVHSKVNSVEELDAADKAATEKIEAIKASLGI